METIKNSYKYGRKPYFRENRKKIYWMKLWPKFFSRISTMGMWPVAHMHFPEFLHVGTPPIWDPKVDKKRSENSRLFYEALKSEKFIYMKNYI